MDERVKQEIISGKAVLGIEFGSTRIKAVLIDSSNNPIASGAFDWENSLKDGIWTYSLDLIHQGLSSAYGAMKADVLSKFGVKLTKLKALGVSAMMHGYMAFSKEGKILVPFRTWRNCITAQASKDLSNLFSFPIPERWSIAHLYQAILNGEEHVKDVDFLTTLAGYVHWKLTDQKVLGIGDASGMFPVDSSTLDYNRAMLRSFNDLIGDKNYAWTLDKILPKCLPAGKEAGLLTAEGAKLLDVDGDLEPGVPLCPPEGDAGTGMVATNSVAPKTGNVSAGTSVFAMVVLEKPLSKPYAGKIDIVTTPDGKDTAMAHANNCTGEYDKWIGIFGQAATLMGATFSKGELYDKFLSAALEGDADCGGLIPFNYISGESMTDCPNGLPLFVRKQDCAFTLQNFMRAQLFTSLAALRTGMDILFDEEKVTLEKLTGHGGFFKAKGPGVMAMSSAMHTPISLMETAGEGGPWGMALLAAYMVSGKDVDLSKWLESEVFASSKTEIFQPKAADVEGFNKFFANYKKALPVEREAARNLI